MGKKSKIGRQRRDRFYHLAKETGYRSRAAFKLIQLNRKFEFLQRARVLVDLCAAPGGWMQVAKQNMPVSSVVIGIDMYPMKPVPGCISLLEDITTDKCRLSIQRELKTWKADVFLHDGAPNLGKNWLHDAYNQNCLTLSALKLGTQFLRPGGWFITKVFRSKDYNFLLWVFKQLFKKVHATKPAASRHESAEIFVVCENYIAPSKIDPRFLNPNYVFKELEGRTPITVQSLLKAVEKDKRKAEGYGDDSIILHTKLPASEFMASDMPAAILQNAYEIILDSDDIKNHSKTTDEIKRCCEDIKVLGKKELKSLISWWKAFRDEKAENKKNKDEKAQEDAEKENNSNDEEAEVDKEIAELMDQERREVKRKRKKTNKEKTKLQLKMNLNMRHKDDLGPTDEGDRDMFHLKQITSKKELSALDDQNPDILADSEDETPKKRIKKVKYTTNGILDDTGMHYKDDSSESELEAEEIGSDIESLGFKDDVQGSEKKCKKKVRFQEPEVEMEEANTHPLITDLDYREVKDKRLSKAKLWFDKDVFKNMDAEEDEDYEIDKITATIKSQGARLIKKSDDNKSASSDEADDSSFETDNLPEKKLPKTKHEKLKADAISSIIPLNEWDVDETSLIAEKKKKKKEKKILSAESLALGSLMANSQKAKRDIINAGWNRYAFNDDGLPEWFVEDEKKYMKKESVIPRELVEEYEKSREELNVRPLKKVMEAKARKKKRAVRRLEKLKKKLENVMDNPDMSEPEKARQAKQMYKKLKQPKPEVKYIVSKKHTSAKRVRRPKGLKGPFRVVDPRLKKDLRAKKISEAKNKSRKSSKTQKRNRKR